MYCIRCGKQIENGVKYCMYCGSPTAEGRKAQASSGQDTDSIPADFFSRRMNAALEDDFTIAIPKNFIQNPSDTPAQIPDPVGEMEYTRMISQADLQNTMEETSDLTKELIPAGLEDDIQQAIADKMEAQDTGGMPEPQTEPEAQDIENAEYTRVMSKDDMDAALAELHSEPEQPIADAEPTQTWCKQQMREAAKQQIKGPGQEAMVSIEECSETAPEQIEPEEHTRTMDKGQIKAAVRQQEDQAPQEIESLEYSRTMTKQEAKEAAAQLGYASGEIPHDVESEEYTRAISKEELCKAQEAMRREPDIENVPEEQEEIDITKIPDIPIPRDFVAQEQSQRSERIYPNPDAAHRRNQIKRREEQEAYTYQEDEEEDGPEQLISVRGIIMVAVVVIALFAIAVGAVVMALQGGEPETAGSAASEVSFSYGEGDG